MFKWLTGGRREAKSNSLDLMRLFLTGATSSAGQAVTAERALGVSVVLRCATLLGNGCSQIPFKLYQSVNDGKGKVTITDHPVAKLIGRRPNRWMTPSEWRRTMTMHAALADFGLSIITRAPSDGRPLELLPVRPDWVSWEQDERWEIAYTIRFPGGSTSRLGQNDVFVLRGPSWDSVKGLGAIRYAREAIGLRMAVDESQAKLFANGARPGGILTAKTPLNDEQRTLLKASWAEMYGGSGNAGKSALMEGDLEFKSLAMSNSDADTMNLRAQQIEEICAAFGVFPQMVGHSANAPTFASAEQFFIQHVVHTLMPWHVAWEEAMATQLLTDQEWGEGYYFNFVVQALLRGTAKERAEFLNLMVTMGAMSPNEVRALEELDQRPELDRFRIPLNTTVMQDDGFPAPLASVAPGLKAVFKVGDRVKVKPGSAHDAMTKDKVGTIQEISTDALGVKFDGMDMVHKWYVAAEIETVSAPPALDPAA